MLWLWSLDRTVDRSTTGHTADRYLILEISKGLPEQVPKSTRLMLDSKDEDVVPAWSMVFAKMSQRENKH